MANGWASITLELLVGNTSSPRTKRVNDSVRSSVETYLIRAHFTALLCCLSSSRIYSSTILTCLQKQKHKQKGNWWEPWKEACLKGSAWALKPKTHLAMIPGCFHLISTAEVIYLPLKKAWLPVSESLLKTSCRKEPSNPYCQMKRDLSGNK